MIIQFVSCCTKSSIDLWRRHRKFGHTILTQGAREGFLNFPVLESKRVLFELLNNSSNYVNTIEDFGAKVMCRLVWANPDYSSELKIRAVALLKQLSAPPDGPYINFVKPLANLPTILSPWKMKENSRHDAERAFFLQLQNEVRVLMAKKRAPPSFMKTFLEMKEQYGFEEDIEGAYLLGQLAIMGSPTIGSLMQNFILAMVQYPQWQTAIQEELDRVVGPDRLPAFEDSPNLPLLRAAIRETLRWRPTVPTGGIRQVEEDNFYDGYLIPKGATVHTSEW
jgi:cytochrome P450